MACRLLDIPCELRYMIYDLLLEGHYEFREGAFLFSITFNSSEYEPTQHLPRGLATCKQILSESISYFHRHAVCKKLSVSPWTRMLPSGLIKLHRFRKIDLRNIEESIVFAPRLGALPDPAHSRIPNIDSVDKLKALAEYLKSRENGLKDLTVRFVLRRSPYPRERLSASSIDLSFFRDFGKLDRVEFIIAEPELDNNRNYTVRLRDFALAYHCVQRELVQAARSLVADTQDNSQRHVSMKDWLDEERFETPAPDGNYWDVDHSWHLECWRSSKIGGIRDLHHEGLPCWLATSNVVAGEMCHFRRVRGPKQGVWSWHCELSNETINVPALLEAL